MKKMMEKFVIRTPRNPVPATQEPIGSSLDQEHIIPSVTKEPVISSVKRNHPLCPEDPGPSSLKRAHTVEVEVDLSCLESDPALRRPILEYHVDQRDLVRRAYLIKGACQPDHNFKQTQCGAEKRRFSPKWYTEFGDWVEYSVSKEAVFCLYCYLFRGDVGASCFVIDGFKNWKKKERLRDHVGKVDSAHNKAYMLAQNLLNQNQHIAITFAKQDGQSRENYKNRLEASIKVIRILLEMGVPFRGHDESAEAERPGNFHLLSRFLAQNNSKARKAKVVGSKNVKMTAPKIQKDIVAACAIETVKAIRRDIGDSFFSLLVDESRDISIKEQMVVAVRYVDRQGRVMERVIGFVHVLETTSLTLKKEIEELLSKHNLSIQKLRGQGYDGASNMRGGSNGLKTLILKENKYAFYIHCFAHQLQLTLVSVAKNFRLVSNFFDVLSETINIVGSSSKRKDLLRKLQLQKVNDAIQSGEQSTGRGLNLETGLKRAADTRWGSHYNCMLRFINMFSSVLDLLDIIEEEGDSSDIRGKAEGLKHLIQTFDFVFKLHMMRRVLAITDRLSQALQKKDQDIVSAMNMVQICKKRFQKLRENGWDDLFEEVSTFCVKNEIDIPNMGYKFMAPGRSRRGEEITNLHHYRVEWFYVIIDMQVNELESRFSEVGTELLLCMACFSPTDSFSSFDKNMLLKLAKFYDADFSTIDVMALDDELDMYYLDVCSNPRFSTLKGIVDLASEMVKTGKHNAYPLVYSLLTFVLILPVATATVERAFSAMKLVKTHIRNQMGDGWMSDSLITYIEQDVVFGLDIKTIAKCFQNMRSRREQLPLDY